MTDPRIARIQAASRMPLPRLATDALADALKLVEAYAAEVARLRAEPVKISKAPTVISKEPSKESKEMSLKDKEIALLKSKLELAKTKAAPQEKPASKPKPIQIQHNTLDADRREIAKLKAKLETQRAARDRADAACAQMLRELEAAKAENRVWRDSAGQARRCFDCGKGIDEGRTCRECLMKRHNERKTKCACGAPKYRSFTEMCRKCWLAVARVPFVPRDTSTPGTCKDCGRQTLPNRNVCPKCSRVRHVRKYAKPCLDCGGEVADIGATRCLTCYRNRSPNVEQA